MTTITVTKDNTGKLIGFTERDAKALARWKGLLEALEPGELQSFVCRFSVNRKFHNLCMRFKRDLFEAQERFEDFDQLRYWLYLGAGHCTWHPGPRGAIVPIPGSFSDKDNDDEEKRVIFDKIRAWCRTGEPAARLWKHLDVERRTDMMEGLLAPYEEFQYA